MYVTCTWHIAKISPNIFYILECDSFAMQTQTKQTNKTNKTNKQTKQTNKQTNKTNKQNKQTNARYKGIEMS